MKPNSKRRKRSVGKHLSGMLKCSIMQRRRETVYRMTAKKHDGQVPCYCCGRHVPSQHATLEHIVPLSRGGTDEMSNLAISHRYCNQQRGNAMPDEAKARKSLGVGGVSDETNAMLTMVASLVEGDRWLGAEACAAYLGQIKRRTFLESIACRPDFPEGRMIGGTRCWQKSEVCAWAMAQPSGRRKRAA